MTSAASPPQEVTLNKVTRATADLDYWNPNRGRRRPSTTPPEVLTDILMLALPHNNVKAADGKMHTVVVSVGTSTT
jgi:hypothetical protein